MPYKHLAGFRGGQASGFPLHAAYFFLVRDMLITRFTRGSSDVDQRVAIPQGQSQRRCDMLRVPLFSASETSSCVPELWKRNTQEEGVSTVEFTGPSGDPLPDESSVGDAAWHGGFDMTLDGKEVKKSYC